MGEEGIDCLYRKGRVRSEGMGEEVGIGGERIVRTASICSGGLGRGLVTLCGGSGKEVNPAPSPSGPLLLFSYSRV